MNIHYPIHERSSRYLLWSLAVAMILASLILIINVAYRPAVVNNIDQAGLPSSQAMPHPVPVPEPPHSQPAFQQQSRVSPVPQGEQFHPVLQPVPESSSGQ